MKLKPIPILVSGSACRARSISFLTLADNLSYSYFGPLPADEGVVGEVLAAGVLGLPVELCRLRRFFRAGVRLGIPSRLFGIAFEGSGEGTRLPAGWLSTTPPGPSTIGAGPAKSSGFATGFRARPFSGPIAGTACESTCPSL